MAPLLTTPSLRATRLLARKSARPEPPRALPRERSSCQALDTPAGESPAGPAHILAAPFERECLACDLTIAQLMETLVGDDSPSDVAKQAADQLAAIGSGMNRDAVREAGGIPPLVAMLSSGAAPLATQQQAVGALWSLAANNTANQDAIREAGGVHWLVGLLYAGHASVAAQEAAAALANLAASNATNKSAIREAGAIAPLMALLQAGAASEAAQHAAAALANLLSGFAPLMTLLHTSSGADSTQSSLAVQQSLGLIASLLSRSSNADELADLTPESLGAPPASPSMLLLRLQQAAERRLQLAADGDNLAELQRAIERARTLQLSEATLQPSLSRMSVLREEEQRSQQRRADAVAADALRSEQQRLRLQRLGMGELRLPSEFVCPITQEKMWDPVVASDGHSYERDAIMHVLFRSNGLSPLTRERLRPELFANIALRKRIEEYEQELCGHLEEVAELVQRRMQSRPSAETVSSRPPTPPRGGVERSPAQEAPAAPPRHASAALPPAHAPAAEEGISGVRRALAGLKLERYVDAMLAHGYDDWNEVLAMTRAKLTKLVRRVGMAENHADRLRAHVAEHLSSAPPTVREAMGVGCKPEAPDQDLAKAGSARGKRTRGGSREGSRGASKRGRR